MTTVRLGCGAACPPGDIGVDIAASVAPDIVADLDRQPWPLATDSADRVIARHVFEHLTDPLAAMREVRRILRPGGRFELTYPIGHARFEDPTHEQFWNYHTAAALVGARKHGHEGVSGFYLADQTVDVSASAWLARTVARARLALGAGPWLSQVPGVAGEVTAVYHTQCD